MARAKTHAWGERIPVPPRLLERLPADLPRFHELDQLRICRHCGLFKATTTNILRNFFCVRFYQAGGPRGFTLLSRDRTPPCDRDGWPANDLLNSLTQRVRVTIEAYLRDEEKPE